MNARNNDQYRDVKSSWIPSVLRAAKWIMLGIIVVSLANVFLNIMDIIFKLGWGYSWISLLVGCAFAVLAEVIRRWAQWFLARL